MARSSALFNMSIGAIDPLKNYRDAIGAIEPLKNYRDVIGVIEPLKNYRDVIGVIEPLKSYHDMIGAIEPFKTYHDMIGAIEPLKTYHDMIGAIEPFKTYHDMIGAIEPLKTYRDMIGAIEPLKTYRDMIGAIEPLKTYRDMIGAIEPLKAYHDVISTIDPLKTYRQSFTSIQQLKDSLGTIDLNTAHSNIFKKLQNFTSNVNDEIEIEIDNSGTIKISTTQVMASELEALSRDIIEKSSKSFSLSLEKAVNKLIYEVQKQQDPLVQKILMWFIFPLMVGIVLSLINPISAQYVNSKSAPNKKALAKELKNSVNSSTERLELITPLRYVSADKLNVRINASRKSEKIGVLYFPSVVIIIEKRKNWSLIEWREPDTEVSIRGWVFSRYLAKFR